MSPTRLLLPLVLACPLCAQGTVSEGLTLFQPVGSTTAYLVDTTGTVVHEWAGTQRPGLSVYLLEDGTLLRTTRQQGGPQGGPASVQKVAWDGTITWSYTLPSPAYRQHHDVEILPDGNVLVVAWEDLTAADAIQAGRNPSFTSATFSPDSVLEIEPVGTSGGNIVWEWHAIDHVIQDFDPTKDNFGVVADHPELLDINYPPGNLNNGDWNHVNAIDYNAELDQIMISSRTLNEVWIIDHSTTTAEAAGHTGGNSGRGGDLLYRYGNPLAYRAGTAADQRFFAQHNAQWIEQGLPGEGNMLVFNNGVGRPAGPFSTVEELVLPVDPQGNYSLAPGSAYGPTSSFWTYQAPVPTSLYSSIISGAQRQPNGNTLVCSGAQAWFFEVTSLGQLVWEYTNPFPLQGNRNVFRAEKYSSCIPFATEALEIVRLGVPPNPDALRPGSTSGPVLGATWDPWIDHASFFPNALVDVLVVNQLAPVNVPSPLGTLLCQIPSSTLVFTQFPIQTNFQVAIPSDCAFAGVEVCAQGASVGGGVIQATNALDLVLGTY